jgi:hypothetical protein
MTLLCIIVCKRSVANFLTCLFESLTNSREPHYLNVNLYSNYYYSTYSVTSYQ